MSNVLLYANGTSENHGCEAISVCTCNILKDLFENMYCSTTNKAYEDNGYSILNKNSQVRLVEYYYYRKKSLVNLVISKLERVFFKSNKFYENTPWISNVLKVMPNCEVALSVGGDNYCNGDTEWLYTLHKHAKNSGCKTVLWGCSVEADCLEDTRMREDIAKYDLVYARESITYETIKKINKNVRLYPDPAFILKAEYLPMKFWNNDNEIIGINISPTIMNFESEKGIVIEAYDNLINKILKTTKYNILMIPHVIFGQKFCDYESCDYFFKKYRNTGRVTIIEDCNCRQIKGYIARCKMMFAARTHASIAAYSMCVPTVVVGYSVKACGIARDLFGEEKNYVIPVQEMKKTDLEKSFEWLEENQDDIRHHLEKVIPGYIKKVYDVRKDIEFLLKGDI